MTRTAILAACRSPVCPRGGALSGLEIHQLAAPVIRACLDRAGIASDQIDELILGNALGAGGNPARLAALAAGLPQRVGGMSIDRQCASGLDAVLLGDAMIRAGAARFVLAGGAESYSRRPLRAWGTPTAPQFYERPAFAPDGFPDPDLTAAAADLAAREGFSRQTLDDFAVDSHAKAQAADLSVEIVPLSGVCRDSFTRALSPALARRASPLRGPITSATAAVAADGAAFVLLGPAGDAPGCPVILDGCSLGGAPADPALAPVAAIRQTLSAVDIAPSDLSRIELMEAYASQSLATLRRAGLDPERTNRGGGALARGHPIGATGAILAVRLVHELRRAPGHGLAAIAAAGGLGTAIVIRS